MKLLLVQCSPHVNGTTDAMAQLFAEGAMTANIDIEYLALRDFKINACIGCGNCALKPHTCIFEGVEDKTEYIFQKMRDCDFALFSTPIYFYALPAHFKAFIDRGQKYWFANPHPKNFISKIIILMAAARPVGAQLFSGGLRTLSWFFKCFNFKILYAKTYRDLPDRMSLERQTPISQELYELGKSLELIACHAVNS